MPERIHQYRILEQLGEGGMGVVYAAEDERLGRRVALKMMRPGLQESARKRLLREARIAAGLNHPNICQVYDFGEDNGKLYIAMELLTGESLSSMLERGPLSPPEAVRIAQGILRPLELLHSQDLVHRDLKPANVFLTPHGVKLLDFGLSRTVAADNDSGARTETALTLAGMIAGTPHYMAPELLRGETAGADTDLFAVGAVLFEMLAGRRAFPGDSMIDVFHAVAYEEPPALSGSEAILAIDQVIRRAIAKRRSDRYTSAAKMAGDLDTLRAPPVTTEVRARAITRFIAAPFRVLRPDPETDFLAFSLPDAISAALSGMDSLLVRSSVAAAKFCSGVPDFKALAAEAGVDVVLLGTLLRAGEQIRVSTQLIEVPSGTLITSVSSQAAMRDLFQIQDELVARIVSSLQLPLTARDHRLLKRDTPASATAYELYLRANELTRDRNQVRVVRDLYRQCLELDPGYAPAWARLGRIYRLIGKHFESAEENLRLSEQALRRALELNPDLPYAHSILAQLESDFGKAPVAMARLIAQAKNSPHAPDLYAGLVYSCRFCGLLEEAIAAHQQARRLDPKIPTSVTQVYMLSGDYQRALDSSLDDQGQMELIASLSLLGRNDEALARAREAETEDAARLAHHYFAALRAFLEDRLDECLQFVETARAELFLGPEGLFHLVRFYLAAGRHDQALGGLEEVVRGGYFCELTLQRDSVFEPIRSHPRFGAIVDAAAAGRRNAREVFRAAGGPALLRLP